nr:MbnP family protein [uncultured Flavobacterium sp.]
MKFQIKNILAVVAISVVLFSCTNNDDEAITGEGSLKVEFDNIYKTADFAANTNYTNSNGEIVSVSKVKYIVSNIVLTKADGTTFTYPKSQSYFILDELTPSTLVLNLSGIPAGNYTKIKYGIGVDKAQFDLGATGQGNFLTAAQDAGMMWSWSAGYKFVLFEGMFTSSTVSSETMFMVHTGQTGTDYNYTEITLDLPANALVRTNITPDVHIFADVAKIIDGTNKVKLSDNNMGGMGAMIMGGANLPLITTNLNGMFSVNHVHND